MHKSHIDGLRDIITFHFHCAGACNYCVRRMEYLIRSRKLKAVPAQAQNRASIFKLRQRLATLMLKLSSIGPVGTMSGLLWSTILSIKYVGICKVGSAL